MGAGPADSGGVSTGGTGTDIIFDEPARNSVRLSKDIVTTGIAQFEYDGCGQHIG